MSTDKTEKEGLLYEMANGFSIDLTEDEYNEKREEIEKIAKTLGVNMKVLDVVEKDYKLKLVVLSMVSYFGYEKVSGAQLLEASRLLPQEDVGDMKYFFMKAGWTPYYLEYEFTPKMTTTFESLIEYFFTDVELYMDMSEELEYVRVPNALRII